MDVLFLQDSNYSNMPIKDFLTEEEVRELPNHEHLIAVINRLLIRIEQLEAVIARK
jgi:hypothetical protein